MPPPSNPQTTAIAPTLNPREWLILKDTDRSTATSYLRKLAPLQLQAIHSLYITRDALECDDYPTQHAWSCIKAPPPPSPIDWDDEEALEALRDPKPEAFDPDNVPFSRFLWRKVPNLRVLAIEGPERGCMDFYASYALLTLGSLLARGLVQQGIVIYPGGRKYGFEDSFEADQLREQVEAICPVRAMKVQTVETVVPGAHGGKKVACCVCTLGPLENEHDEVEDYWQDDSDDYEESVSEDEGDYDEDKDDEEEEGEEHEDEKSKVNG